MQFKKLFFLIIAVVSLALQPSLHGQNGFFGNRHILHGPTELELDPSKVFVYIDNSNTANIEEIRKLRASSFLESDLISRFDHEKTYWLYYQIINSTEETLSHVIEGGANSKETYYVAYDDSADIIIKKTGYHFAANERDIPQGYTTKIQLNNPPQSTAHVYVKIDSQDGMPININAEITPFDQWDNNRDKINLFEGVFGGLLFVIIIVGLFLFFYTGLKVFFYFSLYSLINILYFFHAYGILEIWMFPNLSNPMPFLWLIPILACTFYFAFSREFLEIKEKRTSLDKSLKIAIYVSLAIFIFGIISIGITKNLYWASLIRQFSIAISGLFVLFFLIIVNKKGDTLTRYFTFGTLFLVVAVLVAVATNTIGYTNEVPMYVQIGLIIETTVLSLGISHKLKRDYEEHEITQRSLIIQLQSNDQLFRNANEELTEIVAARTQVIKSQNKELEKARNEADKATKSKSEFLSVMSHEIRTPLNAIISLSHIMEMDNESEEMQEYIDALKFSAEGLHSLINDILDFNKIEVDKLKLESIDFSIIDLLKGIADSFKYKAKSQGIELRIEVGEHIPDRIIGDPTRLTQIFNNLLSNAIKFTHDGYVHLKVSLIGLKDDHAGLLFEVKDTGIGIPKDKLETIFEAYEQAGRETTREYGGTGLGLSITQKLLKLMGSKVNINSREEKGTSLSFEINFKINKSFDLVNLQDQMRDKDLQGKSVLVVDDNDMNRLVLKRLLTNWNADFEEAFDGEMALKKCQNKKFNLILMDIEMKPITGFQAADNIRKTCQINKKTPIIAMSAYLSSEFDIELDQSAFKSLVLNPFEPNELYRRILEQLNASNEKTKNK